MQLCLSERPAGRHICPLQERCLYTLPTLLLSNAYCLLERLERIERRSESNIRLTGAILDGKGLNYVEAIISDREILVAPIPFTFQN